MSESVEGGAALAWRLLATLEGGSLILASSALLAYTARSHLTRRHRRHVKRVLITNTTYPLGKEIQKQFESEGCTCVSSDAISEAEPGNKVDALVVVGAESQGLGLEAMSDLVSKDIYENMKLLDKLSPYVRRGGYMTWACAGPPSGAYSGAVSAFDTALRASLEHTATACNCEAVWIGRQDCVEVAAEKIVAALMTQTTENSDSRFSVRNAALTISKYVGRWLKIIS